MIEFVMGIIVGVVIGNDYLRQKVFAWVIAVAAAMAPWIGEIADKLPF